MTETRLPVARNGHADAADGPEAPPAGPPSRNGAACPAPVPLSPSADGTPSAGKDPATGRFLPGNRLGKGNPHYRKLAENRTAFLQAVGTDQIRQLAAQLLRQALAGNLDAARLLLAYAVGRPAEAVNPDRADLDEFRLLGESPDVVEANQAGDRIAPAYAVVLAGDSMAADGESLYRLIDRLKAEEERRLLRRSGGLEQLLRDDDLDDDDILDEGADG